MDDKKHPNSSWNPPEPQPQLKPDSSHKPEAKRVMEPNLPKIVEAPAAPPVAAPASEIKLVELRTDAPSAQITHVSSLSQVDPKIAAAVEAAFDKSLGGTGVSEPYQTTERLKQGLIGERLMAEALARMGYKILSYKPDIKGTNQGGIDGVAMSADGTVLLLDNKAFTTGRNVSSVSALDKNFQKNLPPIIEEFTQYANDPTRTQTERNIYHQALDSIAEGNYQKAVTHFAIAQDGKHSTGITLALQAKGFISIPIDSPGNGAAAPSSPSSNPAPGPPAGAAPSNQTPNRAETSRILYSITLENGEGIFVIGNQAYTTGRNVAAASAASPDLAQNLEKVVARFHQNANDPNLTQAERHLYQQGLDAIFEGNYREVAPPPASSGPPADAPPAPPSGGLPAGQLPTLIETPGFGLIPANQPSTAITVANPPGTALVPVFDGQVSAAPSASSAAAPGASPAGSIAPVFDAHGNAGPSAAASGGPGPGSLIAPLFDQKGSPPTGTPGTGPTSSPSGTATPPPSTGQGGPTPSPGGGPRPSPGGGMGPSTKMR